MLEFKVTTVDDTDGLTVQNDDGNYTRGDWSAFGDEDATQVANAEFIIIFDRLVSYYADTFGLDEESALEKLIAYRSLNRSVLSGAGSLVHHNYDISDRGGQS